MFYRSHPFQIEHRWLFWKLQHQRIFHLREQGQVQCIINSLIKILNEISTPTPKIANKTHRQNKYINKWVMIFCQPHVAHTLLTILGGADVWLTWPTSMKGKKWSSVALRVSWRCIRVWFWLPPAHWSGYVEKELGYISDTKISYLFTVLVAIRSFSSSRVVKPPLANVVSVVPSWVDLCEERSVVVVLERTVCPLLFAISRFKCCGWIWGSWVDLFEGRSVPAAVVVPAPLRTSVFAMVVTVEVCNCCTNNFLLSLLFLCWCGELLRNGCVCDVWLESCYCLNT